MAMRRLTSTLLTLQDRSVLQSADLTLASDGMSETALLFSVWL